MSIFKRFSGWDWISIAVFCLAAFLAADLSAIKGGVCASSPCSGLNRSFTDDGTVDHYFSSESSPYISPTAGLSYRYFKGNPDYAFGMVSRPYSFRLDSNETIEDRYPKPEELLRNDKRTLPGVFLIHKLFVLLSLPLWFCVALVLRLLAKRNKVIGRIAGILFWLLVTSLLLFSALRFASGMFQGEMDDTLRMLY